MKLSIITPIYNERKRIEEYLEGLEEQSVEPEIVLVDGGSTDGTVEFIKQYQKKHKNVKLYFETGEYRSPANARNIGVKKAEGDIPFVADVDIIIEKDFVRKIITAFKRNRGVKILSFNVEILKFSDFKSKIQEAYYWRDFARHLRLKNNKWLFFLKEIFPFQDSTLGYGEDKLIRRKVNALTAKYNFGEANETLNLLILGPSSLSEVWKRYKWYGRTGMLYYKKSHDKIHLLKMLLAFFSIPFIPLVLVPMARGFIYSLRVIKKYPQGIILIPLLESLAFPAMAVGMWEYLFNKNKKHRGH